MNFVKQYGTVIEFEPKRKQMADGVPNHIFAFPERYNMKSLGRNYLISPSAIIGSAVLA